MENYEFIVGIDVSKLTLDYCILSKQAEILSQGIVDNSSKGLKDLVVLLKKMKININDLLFSFENTGIYSLSLTLFFSEHKYYFSEIPALEIKRSKGISRGKSDKVDAKDIALYCLRHSDKLIESVAPEVDIIQLRLLFSEREKIIESLKDFGAFNENKGFVPNYILKDLLAINDTIIRQLNKSLEIINQKIKHVLASNNRLKMQIALLKSIPGIGDVTAVYLIMVTKGFSCFKNARKFACYAGIAPFEYKSGSSIRGRTKVSNLADKKMKAILHMTCLGAIKSDSEIKAYYKRKREQGKPTMLVMNNIKFKIISRAFAVINRETPFVNIYKYSA